MTKPRGTSSRPFLACSIVVMALALMGGSAGVSLAQPPAAAASLDDILKQVATYDGGIDSAALWKLRDYVYARKDDPAGRAECEEKLLHFMKTPATPVARMAASRYLRMIGSDRAVTALQAMLADERSADMALYALQQIPGAAADTALTQVLKTTAGATKIAVIAALGERRVQAAVPALAPLLQQPAFGSAAAFALGRIGDEPAAAALVASYAGASADLKPVVASSILACADRWLAGKNAGAALRLYQPLSSDASLPVPMRQAAMMGRISAAGSGGAALLLDQLKATDGDMQEAAIARIAEVIAPEAIGSVCALLPQLPERAQVQVLAVLSGYAGERVLPTVLQAARSSALPVRIAAMKALESTGNPSVVPFLAGKAADSRGPEQAAARSALGMLKGRGVDEAILALLAQKPSDAVAGELLAAVADRRMFVAKPVVAASLMSPSAGIRAQALKTLRAIGTPSDLPAVLDLLLKSADESERGEAEKTAAALAQKVASTTGRSREVKARLATEKSPDARVRLFNVLPLIGDNSALPVLRAALEDSSAEVRDAAVRALASWPTSAARDDMARLARDAGNDTHRLLAIVSLVRTVGLDTYRNPEAAVADLKLAASVASRPEEQKLILGAVVSFPCKDALDLATRFLQEPAVKAEAQAAVDNITTRLKKDKDAVR
jgi:HEAT repeat protein